MASRREEGGYAAILVAILAVTILMPLCAISVDVARWYLEVARVQNAADAAATGGVTWMPDNFAKATATAKDIAAANGYPDSTNTTVTTAVGDRPTQLTVTISSKVSNAFGASFGVPSTTVSRSSTADYNGPAPMGSPCNTFGNEPPGTTSTTERGPSTSVIAAPSGGAACTSNPQFWAAIAGPDAAKVLGDAYMTRTCGYAVSPGGVDGCTGQTNDDFNPQGYFYIVRVAPGAVNQPITLQIYDPAWVETGDACSGPTNDPTVPLRNNMNPYTTTDGLTRYASYPPNQFCTGDVRHDGNTPITTSFGLRSPTTTYQPSKADPVSSCVKQYPGYISQGSNPNTVSSNTLAEKLPNSGGTTQIPVTNADFENPKLNDSQNAFAIPPGWSGGSTYNPPASFYRALDSNTPTIGTMSGPSVLWFYGTPGVAQQTTGTTMTAGTTYTLTVAVGGRTDGETFGNSVIGLTANGTAVATKTTTSPPVPGSFGDVTLSYTATAADAGKALGISLGMTNSTYVDYDNVRLTATDVPNTANPGKDNNPNYNDNLAKVFHQWVDFCTFTPTAAGDYYLQARTNVALGGTQDGLGGYQGNMNVFTQTGDDTSVGGNGNNRFALRAKGPAAGSVSIAGWQNMSIYANYSGASPTFNLVRVLPAAQTKTLNIRFFDVGDADNAGTITVLPPTDANITSFAGCTGSGVTNGSLGASCQLSGVDKPHYDGKKQIISVPIPGNYTCNATQSGGCWVRLQMQFPGGVNDTTTWSASIDGDPVRLVK